MKDFSLFERGKNISVLDVSILASGKKWLVTSQDPNNKNKEDEDKKLKYVVTRKVALCAKAECQLLLPPCSHMYVCDCPHTANPCKHIYKIHIQFNPEAYLNLTPEDVETRGDTFTFLVLRR